MKRALLVMPLGLMVLSLTSCWVKKDELEASIDSRFETLNEKVFNEMQLAFAAEKKDIAQDYKQKSEDLESLVVNAIDQMNADYQASKKAFLDDYEQKSRSLETLALSVLSTLEDVKTVSKQSNQEASTFIQTYTSRIDEHIASCDENIPKRIEQEVNDHLHDISKTNAQMLLKLFSTYYESIIDVLASYAIEDASEQKAQEIKTIYDDYIALKQDFYGYLSDTKTLQDIQTEADMLKVEQVKQLILQVTPESIQNTNILSRIANLDRGLTMVQRSKLPQTTAAELKALVTVLNTIQDIDELTTKANDDYALFSSIQANYAKLDEEHRAMVYNFDLQQLYAQYFFLDFTPVNGGLSVKARAGSADKLVGDLVLPATYNNQNVVQIVDNAFQNCSNLTSLVVPYTVSSIGFAAFNGCGALKSISLPFVGKYRSGGNYAERLFGYVFGSNAYFGGTKVDFGTFRNSDPYNSSYKEAHLYYIPTQLSRVSITSASNLSYHAFYNCSMIQNLNLNQEVMILGEWCFTNCSSLVSIDLPYVEAIPTAAFEGCTSLTEFAINEYVTSIGDYAFKGCKNLMKINSEGDGEFVIPKNVAYIGYEAFNGVANIKSLTLPHIGKQRNGGDYASRLFGAIFGAAPYFGGTKVDFGTFRNTDPNSSSYKESHLYYIPSKLRTVTVTNESKISYHAFNNCSMISELRINKEASVDVHDQAFLGSVKPTYF